MSYPFEDDFTTNTFAKWDGSPVVTTGVSYAYCTGGVAGFEANEDVGTRYAYIHKSFDTLTRAEIFVRAYFVLNSLPTTTGDLLTLISLLGNATGLPIQAQAGVRYFNGVPVWTLSGRYGAGLVPFDTDIPAQTGKLYCVELHWKKASASGVSDGLVELFLDGNAVAVIGYNALDNFAGGDFIRLNIGMVQSVNNGGLGTFLDMDDVRVNPTYNGPKVVTPAILEINAELKVATGETLVGNVAVEISYDGGLSWESAGTTPTTYTDPRLVPTNKNIFIRVPAETG